MELIVKTFKGLEQVLAQELEAIGARQILPKNRAVRCEGDQQVLYRANYELRTALRVLVPLFSFFAADEEELYLQMRQFNWAEVLQPTETLAVDAFTAGEVFRHSKYVALKAKDAIVDQFRDKFGQRPSVDVAQPTVRIHLHVTGTECQVSLDSSGESLHRRGYRLEGGPAPINEALAAGLVLLSGYDGSGHFVDPMCGTGTIVIEAAMIATRTPPQIGRKWFGFKSWRDFDGKLWRRVLREAKKRRTPPRHVLLGADRDMRAVRTARKNANVVGFIDEIRWEQTDLRQLRPPRAIPGSVLITNPPYNERLAIDEAFYKQIGDVLKQHFVGYDAWLISSNRQAMKRIGLRAAAKYTLYNGPLECTYNHYPLFSGKPEEAS